MLYVCWFREKKPKIPSVFFPSIALGYTCYPTQSSSRMCLSICRLICWEIVLLPRILDPSIVFGGERGEGLVHI
jgi:hypothetical protein